MAVSEADADLRSAALIADALALEILDIRSPMLVIRRLVDRHRAYTGMFLRGEPPRIFPTSDAEHARILQIYKQDRPYQDVHNDFTDFPFGSPPPPAPDR
jgi:hypothetical protein